MFRLLLPDSEAKYSRSATVAAPYRLVLLSKSLYTSVQHNQAISLFLLMVADPKLPLHKSPTSTVTTFGAQC